MNIKKAENTTTYDELLTGDAFILNDSIYIKTYSSSHYAVNLENGDMCNLNSACKVELLPGTFVYKGE